MKRGELYRVYKGNTNDPKKSRVFVIVSRQVLIDSKFSTVTCAPVYTNYHGLDTQVAVGTEQGLKHDCAIHCDELISIPKSKLSNFVGRLGDSAITALNRALMNALDLEAISFD